MITKAFPLNQCSEVDGGIDCFFERVADGYAKILDTPVDLEGEINDVRAPGSEPMEWWYQVVIRWHPFTPTFVPLSQHFIIGPGLLKSWDQRSHVRTFPVPTRNHSMYWYAGTMIRDGILMRNKLHAHFCFFNKVFMVKIEFEKGGHENLTSSQNNSVLDCTLRTNNSVLSGLRGQNNSVLKGLKDFKYTYHSGCCQKRATFSPTTASDFTQATVDCWWNTCFAVM